MLGSKCNIFPHEKVLSHLPKISTDFGPNENEESDKFKTSKSTNLLNVDQNSQNTV